MQQAILRAAEDVFLEQGFSAASIDHIAAKAGTSKQTVYSRFGAKENLFIAVSNHLLAPQFERITPNDRPLKAALTDVAQQILAAMLDPKLVRMHSIILAEANRFPELAKLSDQDEHFPGREALLTLLQRIPRFAALDAPRQRSIMLMLQDLILTSPLRAASLGLTPYTAEDLTRHAQLAVELFLHGWDAALPLPTP